MTPTGIIRTADCGASTARESTAETNRQSIPSPFQYPNGKASRARAFRFSDAHRSRHEAGEQPAREGEHANRGYAYPTRARPSQRADVARSAREHGENEERRRRGTRSNSTKLRSGLADQITEKPASSAQAGQKPPGKYAVWPGSAKREEGEPRPRMTAHQPLPPRYPGRSGPRSRHKLGRRRRRRAQQPLWGRVL